MEDRPIRLAAPLAPEHPAIVEPPLPPPLSPPPDPAAPEPPEPPKPPHEADLSLAALWDGHVYLWLTRSNRQAKCHECGLHIGKSEFMLIYHPNPSRLPPSQRWQAILWKYYHINRDCMRDLPPQLRVGYAGSERDGSSTATILQSRGWSMITDVAPLPRSAGETRDAREAATIAAVHLANGEFAAI